MQIKQYINSDIVDIKKLLLLVLNKDNTWLYNNLEYELSYSQNQKLNELIKKRKTGYPFAYIKGTKGFYHLDFVVNKHTLIPRPETENIIEIVKILGLNQAKILDLGTGSGIIAITLKSLFPGYKITAVDINPEAIKTAKQNSIKNNTDISFSLSNWFDSITEKFDIIISNPPYIDSQSPYLAELQFEPTNALVAKENGLKDIKEIIKNSPKYLNKNGYLLLEHGYDQQKDIIKLMKNFSNIKTFNDLNDMPRNVLAQLK